MLYDVIYNTFFLQYRIKEISLHRVFHGIRLLRLREIGCRETINFFILWYFLNDTERLKQLLKLTKETDSFYLQKRNISEDYDPLGAYAFENWKQYFNDEIRGRYETLHEDLLYTSNRQSFEKAIQAFEFISHLFASIGE